MKISDLRGILQYVPRFRDRVFVIALDGSIVASENLPNILLDIAVLRSLNIRVVLVHGIGAQIAEMALRRGVHPSNTDGQGLTDPPTLQLAIEAAGAVAHRLLDGLACVDLRAAWSNCLVAHPAGIRNGVDLQSTGKVEKIDKGFLLSLLDSGTVPVVPPIGFDGEGHTYRVNSDAVALEIARATDAAKIICLFPPPGMQIEGRCIRQLPVQQAEEILRSGALTGDPALQSKLEHAARACRHGIPRVHLVDGSIDEGILAEVFSNEGVGTMIYSNEYEQIRHALRREIRKILSLIRQSVDDAELLPRTRNEIAQHLDDYWVLEIDRNIVGCVALHNYPDRAMGELACLFVNRDHENQGYGRKLVSFVEQMARARGYRNLFALSTSAFAYLCQKGGFREAAADILPPERRERYERSGRNSRILMKDLA